MTDYGFLSDYKYLIFDRDSKFCESFREIIKSIGIKPIRLPRLDHWCSLLLFQEYRNFFISISSFDAWDLFKTSVWNTIFTGLLVFVYLDPWSVLCFSIRPLRSTVIPVNKVLSEHSRMYTYHFFHFRCYISGITVIDQELSDSIMLRVRK